jgi:hypothetical protein
LQYGSAPAGVPEREIMRNGERLSRLIYLWATRCGRLPQSVIPRKGFSRSTGKVNFQSLKRVKILAAIALLAMVGCSGRSQRFVPFVEDDTILALDTKTGQTCVSYKQASMPKGGTPMPYCVDLYNSK